MSVTAAFDIDKFMNNSGRVDLSDIRWEDVKKYPLTREALRVLYVFMGVEGSTFFYLKPLISTRAPVTEPEMAPFLSAWVYEEEFHGRAFRQFLEAAGEEIPPTYRGNLFSSRTAGEIFDEVMQTALGIGFARDWPAVHMAWGAIQEQTTYHCYQQLIRRINHPILNVICQRIAKQELKHFAFYFNQAKARLAASRTARHLTRVALNLAWTPVGDGMVSRQEIIHTIRFLLDGKDGDHVRAIERKIGELPGLEKFDLFTRYCERFDVRAAPAEWFPKTGAASEAALFTATAGRAHR